MSQRLRAARAYRRQQTRTIPARCERCGDAVVKLWDSDVSVADSMYSGVWTFLCACMVHGMMTVEQERAEQTP